MDKLGILILLNLKFFECLKIGGQKKQIVFFLYFSDSMNKITTEVCIVGGGPGGVFLSAYLNQYKIPHVVLEAKSFPRSKPCGDSISIHILNRIKELLPAAYDELSSSMLRPNKGIRFYPPNNKAFNYWYPDLAHFNKKPSSYVIKREVLDEVLLRNVSKLPYAQVIQPCRVKQIDFDNNQVLVKGEDIEITSKAVFVASGATSDLAIKLAGNNPSNDHYALGLRAYYKNLHLSNNDLAELYLSKDIFFGACYISCISDDLYNVNIVMVKDSVKEKGKSYRQIFNDFIANHPVIKEKFKNAEIQGEIQGHPLILGANRRKISYKRALLVGDAAGLIDVVTANGIPQAIKSAKIAVDTYIKAKENEAKFEEVFSSYDNTVYTKLKNDFVATRFASKFYGNSVSRKICFSLINLFLQPFLINSLAKFAIYKVSPFKRLRSSFKRKN